MSVKTKFVGIYNYLIPTFIRLPIAKQIELYRWKAHPEGLPTPHSIKQRIFSDYQKRYNLTVFVETGTYLGDTIWLQKDKFNELHSVELDKSLYDKAVNKFAHIKKVFLYQGDSSYILPQIVSRLNQKALFWLDGHYSGGITAKGIKVCPILEELPAILQSKYEHIILIDDARLFNGTDDYPTLEQLYQFVRELKPNAIIECKTDVIRIS